MESQVGSVLHTKCLRCTELFMLEGEVSELARKWEEGYKEFVVHEDHGFLWCSRDTEVFPF